VALPWLGLVVRVESGLLALLLLGLLTWPFLRGLARRWRLRQERRLVAALREVGARPAEAARAARRAGVRTLARVLDDLAPGWEGDEARALRAEGGLDAAVGAGRSLMWWRRLSAARVLSWTAGPEQVPALARLLADRHPAVAGAALLAARRVRLPGLLDPLLDELRSPRSDRPGRLSFLLEVVAGYGEEVVDPVRRELAGRAEEAVTVRLLRLAGRLGDPRLAPGIGSILREGGLEERINAARALSGIPDAANVPEATAALRGALQDPAWQVRAQATTALGKLGAGQAAGDLRRALSDPAWWVRLRAALALRALGPRGADILGSVTREEDRYAHDMAEYVLGLGEGALAEYAT